MEQREDTDRQESSGLLLGSEPLKSVRHRSAAARDDSDDRKDSDLTDKGDDDGTDTDTGDSDTTDKKDKGDDSRDSDGKD